MENKLIKKFESNFKPVDKRVKEEELILFLDNQVKGKFDRDTFADISSRMADKNLEMSPLNFARTYYSAYELLDIKKKRAYMDMNNMDRMSQKLRNEKAKSIVRLVFEGMNIENNSDSSNYLAFEHSPDYATNFYDFSQEEQKYLIVPEYNPGEKMNLRVTLSNPQGNIIDSKNVPLSGDFGTELIKVKFKDSSTLNFASSRIPIDVNDVQEELAVKKNDMERYQNFVTQKREDLAKTFPDVFLSSSEVGARKLNCGFYLIVTCILSAIVGLIGMYLNFTRCMFIDILVSLGFFSNIYIWRNFNLFLAIKLILIMVVSVCLDLSWLIHKAISFNDKYEETVKAERIKGLVLTSILIVAKLALVFFYYKLARENQKDGYLGVDPELSVNEVDADDYLMNPVTSKIA